LLRNATTRLIAAHLLLVVMSTGAVLAFLYWSTTELIDGEVRDVVTAELEGLSDSYERHGVIGLSQAIERRLENAAQRDAVYLLADAYGRPIAGNLAAWPPTVVPGAGWVKLDLYRTDRERSALIAAASILLAGGERLLVGRDAEALSRFDRTLLYAVLRALVAALLLSLATGWLLSRLVLSRITEISDTSADIISGDLSRRVPVRGSGDEFDRLSQTLNRMLDRIEGLIENLRAVTDSLAHDLRSPLTRLRTQLGGLDDPGLDDKARRAAIRRATDEAENMMRTLTSLVEISRAEAGLGRTGFESVELEMLAADAADLYGPVATEKGVNIVVEGHTRPISGNPQLLAQALSNLLENALRYAPEGSEIRIRLDDGADTATLSVVDQGPGIPAADRQRVLERFVTLDPSRSDGGTGLGLALVAAVAKLHGADVRLSDNAPGLVVTLTFPYAGQVGKPA